MVIEDTNALDALNTTKYMGAIEDRIAKTETYNESLHGNTSSMKMKKYALTRKVAMLRTQMAQAAALLDQLEASIERDNG